MLELVDRNLLSRFDLVMGVQVSLRVDEKNYNNNGNYVANNCSLVVKLASSKRRSPIRVRAVVLGGDIV
jgi:hypothetical protein